MFSTVLFINLLLVQQCNLSFAFIDKKSHCFDLTTDQDIEKAESSQSEFIEKCDSQPLISFCNLIWQISQVNFTYSLISCVAIFTSHFVSMYLQLTRLKQCDLFYALQRRLKRTLLIAVKICNLVPHHSTENARIKCAQSFSMRMNRKTFHRCRLSIKISKTSKCMTRNQNSALKLQTSILKKVKCGRKTIQCGVTEFRLKVCAKTCVLRAKWLRRAEHLWTSSLVLTFKHIIIYVTYGCSSWNEKKIVSPVRRSAKICVIEKAVFTANSCCCSVWRRLFWHWFYALLFVLILVTVSFKSRHELSSRVVI